MFGWVCSDDGWGESACDERIDMRFVKTKKTIGLNKYLGRIPYDGRHLAMVRQQVIGEYGDDVVCLIQPKEKDPFGLGQLYVFAEKKL